MILVSPKNCKPIVDLCCYLLFDTHLDINCPEPKIGKEVLQLCTHGNMQYGTVCDFECRPGYSLVGNKKLECLRNGQWNDSFPVCEGTNFLR